MIISADVCVTWSSAIERVNPSRRKSGELLLCERNEDANELAHWKTDSGRESRVQFIHIKNWNWKLPFRLSLEECTPDRELDIQKEGGRALELDILEAQPSEEAPVFFFAKVEIFSKKSKEKLLSQLLTVILLERPGPNLLSGIESQKESILTPVYYLFILPCTLHMLSFKLTLFHSNRHFRALKESRFSILFPGILLTYELVWISLFTNERKVY